MVEILYQKRLLQACNIKGKRVITDLHTL